MGIDITEEFRKAVKSRALAEGLPQEQINRITAASILPKTRQISPFMQAALDVDSSIVEGEAYIKGNRQKYTIAGASTDAERDAIEQEVALLVKACVTRINQLQKTAESSQQMKSAGVSPQGVAHLHGITLILSEKLKGVTTIFNKYRSQRAHHVASVQQRRQIQRAKEKERQEQKEMFITEDTEIMESSSRFSPSNGQVQEMASMEQENKALFDELSDLSQAVHSTERMMHEIATLNQMFSAQVLSQAEQIEHVYACAVESSLNMDHGNKQLKRAIKMNKSTTKYVIAILLSATFLLLFFDWFNS